MIVVGVDPSSTSTGVAVLDTEDLLVIETHTVKSAGRTKDSWAARSERIIRTADQVAAMVPAPAHVVMEAPSLGQRAQSGVVDRMGLWWRLFWRFKSELGGLTLVPPASRAKYATGKGNAAKDAVMLAVAKRYPQATITGNDEADAVALAAIGARLAGHPIEDSLPKTHLEALTALTYGG